MKNQTLSFIKGVSNNEWDSNYGCTSGDGVIIHTVLQFTYFKMQYPNV